MSNITYNRNKVAEFKLAFQEYQAAKELYNAEMEEFQKVLGFMEGKYDHATSSDVASSENYIVNQSGILMKTVNGYETIYDNSVNTVINVGDNKKVFISDVKYTGDTSTVNDTNKLYQFGLSDLEYKHSEENILTGDDTYTYASGEPIISNANDCTLNNLSQCSARAKMENKSYYGIEGGTDSNGDSICNCYILDTMPTDVVSEKLKTIVIDGMSDVAYLATLMDGSFYKIKESIYSDNYNGFYQYDGTNPNISLLIEGGRSGLNPFVGNGINSIQITELGQSSCSKN
uniref:Uncharacterized protein n=1 Tax=viral metagenome TaxID=1070528 RepID=A0A6C0KWX1_9ZZZZ|tara:strand:- start:13347 stop:14210 length:864 start_codon:yes stop_codon:yes gene_type:complete